MAEKQKVTFEIIKNVGVLAERDKGWAIEANIVSWNGDKPKLDIRSWNEDKSRMGKGITLDKAATKILLKLLKKEDVAAQIE